MACIFIGHLWSCAERWPFLQVVNRVKFIMNNLSQTNCEQKTTELQGMLPEEHWQWFSDYLVVTRAAQEPNFHDLYLTLIRLLNLKVLWDLLTSTTYKYVRILLESERIKTQSGERSLLRNLGSWLGRLTIQRNKMVLFKQLDLKGIMYQVRVLAHVSLGMAQERAHYGVHHLAACHLRPVGRQTAAVRLQ